MHLDKLTEAKLNLITLFGVTQFLSKNWRYKMDYCWHNKPQLLYISTTSAKQYPNTSWKMFEIGQHLPSMWSFIIKWKYLVYTRANYRHHWNVTLLKARLLQSCSGDKTKLWTLKHGQSPWVKMFVILKRRLLTTAVQRAGWGREKASYKRKAASFV